MKQLPPFRVFVFQIVLQDISSMGQPPPLQSMVAKIVVCSCDILGWSGCLSSSSSASCISCLPVPRGLQLIRFKQSSMNLGWNNGAPHHDRTTSNSLWSSVQLPGQGLPASKLTETTVWWLLFKWTSRLLLLLIWSWSVKVNTGVFPLRMPGRVPAVWSSFQEGHYRLLRCSVSSLWKL